MPRTIFKSNLPQLLAEKADNDQPKYKPAEIANETGLSRQVIYLWLDEDKEISRLSLNDIAEPLSQWLGCEWYHLVRREVVQDSSSE